MNTERFIDNQDGTILDNLTGLVWLKNDSVIHYYTWSQARNFVHELNKKETKETNWKLPSIKELLSIIDYSQYNPADLSRNLFLNVKQGWYWSGTTYAPVAYSAWIVNMSNGCVNYTSKTVYKYVWPVRDVKEQGELKTNKGLSFSINF